MRSNESVVEDVPPLAESNVLTDRVCSSSIGYKVLISVSGNLIVDVNIHRQKNKQVGESYVVRTLEHQRPVRPWFIVQKHA